MNIAVLAGGNSTERDVSLVSGREVYEALKSKGHKVVLIDVYLGVDDVDVDNVFEDKRDWAEGIKKIAADNPDLNYIKSLKGNCKDFFGKNVREICMKADFVFMALHGANGEDGRIQAALDLMQVKYSGTDYLSSAICMDKSHSQNNLEMKYTLGPLEFEHYPLLLAPMEDVSDPPFRYVCKMFGADVVYSAYTGS